MEGRVRSGSCRGPRLIVRSADPPQGARAHPFDDYEAAATGAQLTACRVENITRDNTRRFPVAPIREPCVDALVIGPQVEDASALHAEEPFALDRCKPLPGGPDLSAVLSPVDRTHGNGAIGMLNLNPRVLRLWMDIEEQPAET